MRKRPGGCLAGPVDTTERTIVKNRIERESDMSPPFKFTGVTLGKGQFGTVVEAVDTSNLNRPVAVKKIIREQTGSYQVTLIELEMKILESVRHPYIIELITVYESPSVVYLIFEKCDCELEEYLNEKNRLEESESRLVIQQCAGALKYLHRKRISHRDIKCENILIVRKHNKHSGIGINCEELRSADTDEETFEIRITDFGLAVASEEDFQEHVCGTPFYMAPEVLQKQSYSEQCDIWSLGIIAYRIITGVYPFDPGETQESLVTLITKPDKFKFDRKRFSGYNVAAIPLVRSMLTVDPAKRIRAGEIEENGWVKHGKDGPKGINAFDIMRQVDLEGDITDSSSEDDG